MKSRNSIIELIRFLAALWVVYYHDMFFVANNTSTHFSDGKISVDFFFMLSGLFFLKSYSYYKEKSVAKNFVAFSSKRLKAMGVALPIGLVFSTIYFVLFPTNNYGTNFIFGYLWFIPAMFVALLFYFFVCKIKYTKVQIVVILGVVVACYILAFIFRQARIFSAFAGIGLGILISKIPNVPLFETNKTLSAILSFVLIALCILFAYLPKTHLWVELTLIFVLFPAFLYLSKHFTISIPIFNHLGKLSFGIYAMQSVVRVFRDCKILTNNIVLCSIIFALAILCMIADKLLAKVALKKRKAIDNNTTSTTV